jgi:diguanylate cyclase (GGDEF)-like protein
VSAETINILLVEDNPGDARLFREALQDAYSARFDLTHCKTFGEALNALDKAVPHVIVVDLGLPDAFGIEVVSKARAAAPSAPIVVLTGSSDEALGVEALQEGAQDYLVKGDLDPRLLSRTLRHAMERHRMQEVLRNESLVDELTGLYNRRGFLALARNHLKLADRTRVPFALVFVDLDAMKHINDSLGHSAGDRALIETAGVLQRCLRQSDILARLGGDEFVLLLTAANENTEQIVRQRLQEQLNAINSQHERRYQLSLSVGVTIVIPPHSDTLEQLMAQADRRMYQQKQCKKK